MEIYIAKHKEFATRIYSRSGGAFTAFSDHILSQGGVVYGVKMDGLHRAVHARATTRRERDAFRGSKYIQSELGGILSLLKQDVKSGTKVLFTGTGCQIAAAKLLLEDVDTSNTFFLEIVCHGVPSPKIWRDYCDYIEAEEGKTIEKIDFRNKMKYGWRDHIESFYFTDGSSKDTQLYREMFYSDIITRPCCHRCPFKKPGSKHSDIVIADAWGIENETRPFNDDNGVSLVLLLTDKARELFKSSKSDLDYLECDFAPYRQRPLSEPFPPDEDRQIFWNRYEKGGFTKAKKWFIRRKIKKAALRKIKKLFRR